MAKSRCPDWILNQKWAIDRNARNWILYRKSGSRWRPGGYYSTLALLFDEFLIKLTLTEPPQPSLVEHIEHCHYVAQAGARAFNEQISTLLLKEGDRGIPAASTSLGEEVGHAS